LGRREDLLQVDLFTVGDSSSNNIKGALFFNPLGNISEVHNQEGREVFYYPFFKSLLLSV